MVCMGWFDWLTGGEEGQVERHARRVKDLNSQAEDRQASAQWLATNGTEKAIYGLLGRFSVNYEQQMKDAQEKELVTELLRGLGGEKILSPVQAWVRKHEAFARPLALVHELSGPAAAVDILLDLLGREVDPFKPEKKRQILLKLADYRDGRITPRVSPCLEDFDEGVRYAAAEAMIAQEGDGGRLELGKAMANRQEESNRLRVRIAQGFHQKGWTVAEFREPIAERPPVGWRLVGDRLVPAA